MAENVHCRIVENIGKFRYLARLFGGERFDEWQMDIKDTVKLQEETLVIYQCPYVFYVQY